MMAPPTRDPPSSAPANPFFKHNKVPATLKATTTQRQQVESFVDAMEQTRKDALEELYNFGMSCDTSRVALETKGTAPGVVNKLKILFFWDNRELDPKVIRDKLRVGRRHESWMKDSEFLPWNPESWQLRLFLLDQHRRGSSVAKSELQALQWSSSKVHMEIGASEDEVKATATAVNLTLVKQAVPVSLRVWLALEQAVASASSLIAGLAAIWILKIITSLRFAHIQRSVLVKVTAKAMVFYCSLSKTKRGGTRHPFLWICPRVTLLEKTDLVKVLSGCLGANSGSQRSSLVTFGLWAK
jgi:hypothetical protein